VLHLCYIGKGVDYLHPEFSHSILYQNFT